MKLKLLFTLLFMSTILAFGQTVPDSGIIAYYPFDGNANDYSGNNLHPEVYGPELTTDRFGNPDHAYAFDGIDDYMKVKDTSLLNPDHISISVWYKPTYFAGVGNHSIIDKGYFQHSPPYYQYHIGVTGNYTDYAYRRFASDISSVEQSGELKQKHIVTENGFWEYEQWYLLCMTYDGTVMHFYINNNLFQSVYTSGPIESFNKDLFIGKFSNRDEFTSGIIDDIRIYNRALSHTELGQLYSETICSNRTIQAINEYYVSSPEFESVSPKSYYTGTDSLTNTYGCDSIVEHFDKYIYRPECTDTVTFIDTVSVTDTLIIEINLTDLAAEDLINKILVYPNPTNNMVYINMGEYFDLMSDHKIRISNIIGEVIFETYVNQSIFEVNVTAFGAPGTYVIQFINNQGIPIVNKKIVVTD